MQQRRPESVFPADRAAAYSERDFPYLRADGQRATGNDSRVFYLIPVSSPCRTAAIETRQEVPLHRPRRQTGAAGVAKTWQRQGIGEILMVEAMQRTLLIAENAGIIGLFVGSVLHLWLRLLKRARYKFFKAKSNKFRTSPTSLTC